MRKPIHAWVRAPGASYGACLREDASRPIDVARARHQHAAYVAALRAEGVAVTSLPADEACPDGCFIEDTAVLWDGGGVLTSMRAPTRAGEGGAVARALAQAGLALAPMAAGAHLDGGDVLRSGARVVVGRSERTTAAGIAALAAIARRSGLEVVAVEVSAGLHLKSAVTLIDEGTAIVHGDAVDRAALERLGLELVDAPERHGGNVLALGDAILVSAAAPATAATVTARGRRVVTLDVSELHAGDGGLTCLSQRQPAPGSWCA
jgi:dimethylargininase